VLWLHLLMLRVVCTRSRGGDLGRILVGKVHCEGLVRGWLDRDYGHGIIE
jgi:hypothetical protein